MKQIKKIDISKKKGVFLFLDFDGTIAPIVRHFKDAVIDVVARNWLKELVQQRNIKIAIVTGRGSKDVHARVKLPNLYYVANHGMEISYRDRSLLKRGWRFRAPLKRFGDVVETALKGVPRVLVEKKGLSVAVHFRRVDKKYHRVLKKIVRETATPYVEKYDFDLTKGKMILELRPSSDWNKGKAVNWLWKRTAPSYFPIYIGDDVTDEDAFKVLRSRGLTIRVGGRKEGSYANYYATSIKEVIKLWYFNSRQFTT